MAKGFKKKNGKGGHDFIPTDKKTVRSSEPSTEVNIEIVNNDSDEFSEGVRKDFEEDEGKKLENIKKMFEIDNKYSKERIEIEYDRFTSGITDFGSGDISTAVEKYSEVGLGGSDLADDVREWVDSTNAKLEDADVCYVAWDRILQEARNELDSVLGFDITNDIKGGTEFYVAGNYMATSYDYSSEAVEQLKEKLLEASPDELERLSTNVFVKSFLSDIDIF